MSIRGIISYIVCFLQIAFLPYNWWVYIKTGSGQWCEEEQTYLWVRILHMLVDSKAWLYHTFGL